MREERERRRRRGGEGEEKAIARPRWCVWCTLPLFWELSRVALHCFHSGRNIDGSPYVRTAVQFAMSSPSLSFKCSLSLSPYPF